MNDYAILADYIVSKYIERVSGDDINGTFVDDDLEKRVMVGMLAENRVDESFSGGYVENNNTRFESVPSMSLSFLVNKNESGVLKVIPKGSLFYTVKPDYKKTIDFVVQKYTEKDNIQYKDINQLADVYPEEYFYLPLTYKKISIEETMGDGIEINLAELKNKSFHLEANITEKLLALSNQISDEICIMQTDRVHFGDLMSEEVFKLRTAIKNEKVSPRWTIDIYCTFLKKEINIDSFYRWLIKRLLIPERILDIYLAYLMLE